MHGRGGDKELFPVVVHGQHGLGRQILGDDHPADKGLDLALQEPLERACAVDRVIPAVTTNSLALGVRVTPSCLSASRACRDFMSRPTISETSALSEGLIEYDLVDPVEELRTELLFEQVPHLFAGSLADGAVALNALEDNARSPGCWSG